MLICFAASIFHDQLRADSPPKTLVINAVDYGIKPNTYENISPQLRELTKAASKQTPVKIVFEPGRYDIWPEGAVKQEYYISNTSTEEEAPSKIKTIGLHFDGFENLTIDGNGALFIIHGKMINFAFVNSENITLQNIHFDYERPTVSELTIEEVAENSMVASINPSAKFHVEEGKFQWYGAQWTKKLYHTVWADPETSTSGYGNWQPFLQSHAEVIGASRVRFNGDFSAYQPRPGQILGVRDPIRDQVGAFIAYSKNIMLKNVHMHFMHGMGIMAQFSENLTYDSVVVAPRDETSRQFAAFADCFHFSGCKGAIKIINCKTSGSQDDAINVHGTHLKIVEIISPSSLKVRFMHGQSYGFKAFFPGDTLEFVQPKNLLTYGQGVVQELEALNPREIILYLKQKVPKNLKEGDVIENITWTPSLQVTNCDIRNTNTRGILVTTRKKVLIENNTFYRTGMHAILIADDGSSWYESGPVRDVTIRNNKFVDNAYNNTPNNYIINIQPENHQLIDNGFVHSNITIENNTFEIYDHLVLNARSVHGLSFRHNAIIKTNTLPVVGSGNPPSFNFVDCRGILIAENQIDHDKVKVINTVKMTKTDIEASDKLVIRNY